ncbi:MAG: hypothetical protein HOK38_08585 [Flavobacteriaceae bacterium]|nr:hypothetical protein [Flavobacteriaceae bacterium]
MYKNFKKKSDSIDWESERALMNGAIIATENTPIIELIVIKIEIKKIILLSSF